MIRLTPDEIEAVRALGSTPNAEYIYCVACWRVVSDREHGAQLLKGLIQARLRARGVKSDVPDRLYRFLIEGSTKGRVS